MISRDRKFKSKGFSLVELMLVVAVIGILAAIVTVSLSGQRDKAKDTQILAELSATIQPILMCRSDKGTVNLPASGGVEICDLSNNYGVWPDYGTDYLYAQAGDFNGDTSNWYFYVDGEINRICCNETSNKCNIIAKTALCDGDVQL